MEATRLVDMAPQLISKMIAPTLDCYPVERAWLFGSVARGDQRGDSDIDLIVELCDDARLELGFIDLQNDLTKVLRHAVDVSTLDRQRSTKAFITNYDNEKVLVYERAPR